VVGDGGFALSGVELSTAVRENINMTVLLLNDNNMGLIRLHQLSKVGHSHAVKTSAVDYAKFCQSLGVTHFTLDDNFPEVLEKSLKSEGVSLIEVILKDSLDIQKATAKGHLRKLLKI
jgi:thiamine pyrophosphate-dependent acetolactate synthase large subunit-like protein